VAVQVRFTHRKALLVVQQEQAAVALVLTLVQVETVRPTQAAVAVVQIAQILAAQAAQEL
jgi:hypothetical protein